MRLVRYTPELYGALHKVADRFAGNSGLRHQPFVDYYYTTRDWCELYLFLSEDDEVIGTIGVDQLRFEYEGQPKMIGFASNFNALQEGVGGHLFLRWIKTCPMGAVFGGSADTHRLIQSQKWTYFSGVRVMTFQPVYVPRPQDAIPKKIAKQVLRRFKTNSSLVNIAKQIPRSIESELEVREESEYSEDLLPQSSPFTLRFAPTIEYVDWRYNLNLSFVRYRLFRLLHCGKTCGYVILNQSPSRMMVAQCDGENAELLSYGVLLSLAAASRDETSPRQGLLSSSHPRMQEIFSRYGFVAGSEERPFVLGSLRKGVPFSGDTTNWLINFDWTDNGLRAPFLDQ